jgi:hypothetical protein
LLIVIEQIATNGSTTLHGMFGPQEDAVPPHTLRVDLSYYCGSITSFLQANSSGSYGKSSAAVLLLLTVHTAGLVRDFGPHLTADVVHAMGPRLTSALVGEFGGSFTSQLVRAFGYPLTAGEALFKGASTTYMQLAGVSVGLLCEAMRQHPAGRVML